MEEEVTSVNNPEVAEQEESVESTDVEETTEQTEVETTNNEGQTETTEEQTETEESKEGETKEPQSKEDNSKYRQARIKAEKEAEKKIEAARKEAYEQGLKQGKVQSYIGKQNPYTGKEILDSYDVDEYLDMYELDSKGQDPIEGYIELQKQKAREEAEKKIKADEEAKRQKWYQDDTNNFLEKYSEQKLQELKEDKDFLSFAEGKIGNVALAEIYENYKKLISKFENKSIETAKQIVANNSTTPGAMEESEPQTMDWNKMSKKDFEKYVKKAKDGELK